MTLRVAKLYYDLFKARNADVHLVSLEGANVYEEGPELKKLEERYFIPSDKFVFVMPEYNGSFPGVLKLMIDNSNIKKCWWYKKALLAGVADGRGGNLRGIEHMTNILHYMRMNVHYNKLPLSRINDEVSPEGVLLKEGTKKAIENQIDEFLNY
jgi:NAD(P)H-dependent FMN reductase